MPSFIGKKFLKSKIPNITGLEEAKALDPNSVFIDLGAFSTRIYKQNQTIEFLNFFTEVEEKSELLDGTHVLEVDNRFFIYGTDAIDFAKLQNKQVKEIFKNKEFYLNDINTFEFIKQLFVFDEKTIVINEQKPTVEKLLKDYFTSLGKKVIFVNNALAQLKHHSKSFDKECCVVLDLGYESTDFLFMHYGIPIEYIRLDKGSKWINQQISQSTSLDIKVLTNEISQNINVNKKDGLNLLYKYFLETLLQETFEIFIRNLLKNQSEKLLENNFILYCAGGVFEQEGVKEVAFNIIKNLFTPRNFQIVCKKDHLSIIKGISPPGL